MTSVPPRVAAVDAIRTVASQAREFRVRDVIATSNELDESHRSTVQRALRDMAALGNVSQRADGSPVWESLLLPGPSATGSVDDLPDPPDELTILHAYADRGAESHVLQGYGEVVRVGWDAHNADHSTAVRADVTQLPFSPDASFDLGLFHPPCTRWANMTSISGDPEDHPNLIPETREVARACCDEWIIENRPNAPLHDPVVLSGKQFGLPINYERAFETSFPVREKAPMDVPTEISSYFSADRSRLWWAAVKGYPTDVAPKGHLAKNCVPAAVVHYLLRNYLRATNRLDADHARSNHSDPTPRRIAADD